MPIIAMVIRAMTITPSLATSRSGPSTVSHFSGVSRRATADRARNPTKRPVRTRSVIDALAMARDQTWSTVGFEFRPTETILALIVLCVSALGVA